MATGVAANAYGSGGAGVGTFWSQHAAGVGGVGGVGTFPGASATARETR